MQGSIRWMAMSLVMAGTAWGQTAPAGEPAVAAPQVTIAPTAAQITATPVGDASGGTITGTVKAGTVPLPGVAVTATNTLTGKKYATTTDVNGSFAMAIPRNGRYVVKAELAAFATETKEVLINAAGENGGKAAQVAEFGLQLASRVQEQEARQAAAREKEKKKALFIWAVGAALFANVIAFFGISYFDQTIVGWYGLLALISATVGLPHKQEAIVLPLRSAWDSVLPTPQLVAGSICKGTGSEEIF